MQAAEEDGRRRATYEDVNDWPPSSPGASDDRIEYINAHALPRECGPLLVAELVARGLDGFVRDSVNIPRIVRRVQLPAFPYDIHAPYAWPRSSSVDAGNLMFRAVSELGSRSA